MSRDVRDNAKWGNLVQSLLALLGAQANTRSTTPGAGVSFVSWIKGVMALFIFNQPHTNVSLAAIDNFLTTSPTGSNVPDAANTILNLQILAGSYYKLDRLNIQVTSFGTGTFVDITLWVMVNGTMQARNTIRIGATGQYNLNDTLSLNSLFGIENVVGEAIAITAITSLGSTGALAGSAYYSTSRYS